MTKPFGTVRRAAAARRADDLLAQRAARFLERESELHRRSCSITAHARGMSRAVSSVGGIVKAERVACAWGRE